MTAVVGDRSSGRPTRALARSWVSRWAWAGLFAGPALTLLGVFGIGPMLYAIWISLFDYGITGSNAFVGAANYVAALQDPLFWKSMGITSTYAVGSAALGLAGALGLALLVTQKLPFMGWFRVLYFVPSVGSVVALGTIWAWLLDYNLGLINYGLRLIGVAPVPWLLDGRWALVALVLIGSWGGASYNLPIYAAGLESVSHELYEAAELDGAGAARRFWHITLPGIAPITRYTVIMAIIGSFQVLGLIDVLTGGGPLDATLVTIKYIWQQGWYFLHLGYASAISTVMLVFLFVVTWQQLRTGHA